MFFEKIYWELRYAIRRKKLNRHKNKKPYIYWDRNLKEYVNPLLLEESTDNLTYLCSELARTSPYYSYRVGNKRHHTHQIDELFMEAYNYAERFRLEDKEQLSKQELEIVERLVRQGKFDRRNYH